MIPSSSMASTRGSTLKVSRSSSDSSPANAPMDSHWWVIFDAGDMVLENALTSPTVFVPCSCLRVTIYLPGKGFVALKIRKRGEGAARAGRVQRARATSLEQNIVEEPATTGERSKHGGLEAKRDLPGGWRKACKILAYAFIRNDTQGPPDDVLMVFRANERLGGTSWLGAGAGENNGHTSGVACSHGLCAGVGGHGSLHRNSAEYAVQSAQKINTIARTVSRARTHYYTSRALPHSPHGHTDLPWGEFPVFPQAKPEVGGP